jgi:hypothetical protein
MKILIVGLPLFAKRLAEKLSAFDPSNRYVFLNTYYSKKDQLKALFHLPTADLVFSINGTLTKSRLFTSAFRKKIPVIMNWVGTDVQVARSAVESKTAIDYYRTEAVHFCEVKWIKEELAALHIDAKIQNFAAFPITNALVPFNTEQLSVLTYINDARSAFYGMKEILALAERFPTIHFYIVGTTGANYEPLPDNVHAVGWVENMSDYFAICQVAIRFPEHDGLATFVLESLAKGKHVLYKYPFDFCRHTPTFELLKAEMEKLQVEFELGKLQPNTQGVEFIKSTFNEQVIFGSLIASIQHVIKSKKEA